MPYLTCIGGQGVAGKNKSGAGARGYWVYRRGTVVTRRHGPVVISRRGGVSIRWLRYRDQINEFSSIGEARDYVREVVREKTEPAHGYSLLPPGVRILKPLR
jgi:hypothetical protein